MANRRNPSDRQDEARLEQLLKSGYADPAPSEEFEATLLRQLQQEYVHTYFPGASFPDTFQSPLESSPLNGLSASVQSAERTATCGLEGQASKRPRRRVTLRLAMTLATAASLLFSVALWNSQNAYGWASMLRALDNCGWVQAVAENVGLSGWVSSRQGVFAVRGEDEIAYYDRQQQSSSRYLAEHQVVYQQPLPADHSSLGASELFRLILGDDSAELQEYQDYKVIAESWRHLESDDSQAAAIELQVTLRDSGPRRRTHKLVLLLDPETRLPRSCRLLGEDSMSGRELTFDYPTEGPESIFSLGIPKETRVVASLADLEVLALAGAQDSEANRLLRSASDESDKQASAEPNESVQLAKKTAIKKTDKVEPDGQQIIADKIITAPAAAEIVDGDFVVERVATKTPRAIAEAMSVVLPEQLPELADLVEQVNSQLATSWQSQGLKAAEPASDTEFLRRVYLDLTGRIPIVSEVYEFLESDPQDRRERLVDDLLASRDHATHLATVWRKLLLPGGVDPSTYGGTGKFDEWLANRFEQNLPYDQLVRELLLAEGRVSDSGPILFYATLKLNPEEIAAKTARTFLGMRMECAQCHDHKFDDSITQEDFWGFAAHFAQISRPRGKMDMTSSVLRVRDNNRGEVMLPDTDEVIPPRMPYQVETTQVETADAPADSLSRREQLVEWLTTKQNARFARATVNRAWQHLFGLGLVEPVDDMRDDNPSTCPEVLETLSLDFAASNYDLRRLLRTLVLSDAYQLSSRATSDEPSQSLVFARMNIKSFSADQLYDCINVATEPDSMGARTAANGALQRFGNTSRAAFIEQFRAPPGQRTDYHAGIPQALTLMHGRLVEGATGLETSGLLKSLSAPFFTDEQRIETLFLSTLSRYPEPIEQEKMLAYVQAATDDAQRSRALGDVLWALLNSAEFTFIH